ncbi:alpha/beta fold hydrolase [Streptomyces kunmingensis]|uniref:Alpha/beta fold hydrolase n=1 Tax=Streptomyces kunmingensis TaxID=68225 RepID=A0ABU6CQD2_9ACTN|nr:alpha/beta hydrolase [Streptomyces kunmingensis]MEB3966125.1 alpha/beta fold hydrolase [Streptomyces kunmingensis]
MAVFRTDDGIRIAYEVYDGGSRLPLVLLHHGFIASGRTNWEMPGIVDALTRTGRRVATIDARGHGSSDKPHDPALYGEARMARDVMALIDLLDEPVYDLVGYSMGAIVTLLTAGRDRRVRRLVVGGVGAGVVECGGVDTRVIGGQALQHALRTDDPGSVTDPTAAGFRAFVDAVGGDRPALAAQAAAAHAEPIALQAISVPALVIAGREDPLAVRPETLATALPRGTLRLVDGDHLGALRDPEFTSGLVEFLSGDSVLPATA